MSDFSDFEEEREANIARNREILAKLELSVDLPVKSKSKPSKAAKPVQPAKRTRREKVSVAAVPTRQSTRLRRGASDINESPSKKRKREQEEEERRRKEEDERLEAEERAQEAKRPRHQDLDLQTVTEDFESDERAGLRSLLQEAIAKVYPKRTGNYNSYVYSEDEEEQVEVAELKKLGAMKVVARAKVTQDRVYSAAYHPEPTKDLIFFGDKHGQVGIWDARAPAEEAADEDGDIPAADDGEGGKYWRLQVHWPATSKSSISTIKLDPINSHSIFTTSYDCTIRCLSFTSGISQEIFSTDEILISSIDLPPAGNEMWISDAVGGLTHLDLREDKSKARWYQVSDQKIGSVSINPTNPHFIVTASNSRLLRIWDVRKLETIDLKGKAREYDIEVVDKFLERKQGQGCLRGEWRHGKSVSSAYWDPRGRAIVSTSYDDNIRLWEIGNKAMHSNAAFPSSRPFSQIKHNCQTGKWLTILKAQWSPNPDHYPHFTIGNMDHSLDIFSCRGDLIASLADRSKITAVQAVTCSHPSVLERAASGNASGRCVLWAPADL